MVPPPYLVRRYLAVGSPVNPPNSEQLHIKLKSLVKHRPLFETRFEAVSGKQAYNRSPVWWWRLHRSRLEAQGIFQNGARQRFSMFSTLHQ